MEKKALTLTILTNMTCNYGDSIGNVSALQKVFIHGVPHSIRTRESLKHAILSQSGFYDQLQTEAGGKEKGTKVNQKVVNESLNAATCRYLEGGYLNTKNDAKRVSSFFVTNAVSCEPYSAGASIHNNIGMAQNYIQNQRPKKVTPKDAGQMIYYTESNKNLMVYSVTIDLPAVGRDDVYDQTAPAKERAERVIAILEAVRTLSLLVKGSLDNAEPIFVAGGLCDRRTHYFENALHVNKGVLEITKDLKEKLNEGYMCALRCSHMLKNEAEIEAELKPLSMNTFFEKLEAEVRTYFEEC